MGTLGSRAGRAALPAHPRGRCAFSAVGHAGEVCGLAWGKREHARHKLQEIKLFHVNRFWYRVCISLWRGSRIRVEVARSLAALQRSERAYPILARCRYCGLRSVLTFIQLATLLHQYNLYKHWMIYVWTFILRVLKELTIW